MRAIDDTHGRPRHLGRRSSSTFLGSWIALTLFACGVLAFGLFTFSSCGCSQKPRAFNVVLITLDTTRADYLGCYGKSGDPTPNFDAIARDGTRFDMAIASAAVTPVAHASILTGLDNREHGLRVLSGQGGFRLPADIPTLATVLHDQGYSTAAVHSAFPVSAYFGFQRGFDVFDSFDGVIQKGVTGNMTWPLLVQQRRSDETTNLVLDDLKDEGRPFFLWVHYWDPHDNVRVPDPQYLGPELARDSAGNVLPSRELYGAEVRYVDAQFGRLVASLKASGDYDNTIFVIVADHGEGLGDHGWPAHRILYQEQVRVPLIVRIPGVRAASSFAGVVRSTDIYPTVLDYLGVAAPRPPSGKSLRAPIEGRSETARVAFADQVNGYDLNAKMLESRPDDDFVYAVVDLPWKWIYRPMHPEKSELFDLAADPRETKNLREARPEIVLRMQKLLAEHGGWVTADFPPIEGSGVDPATAAKILSDLGYVAGASHHSDARWAFACPEHPTEISDEPTRCPRCSALPVLVRRR